MIVIRRSTVRIHLPSMGHLPFRCRMRSHGLHSINPCRADFKVNRTVQSENHVADVIIIPYTRDCPQYQLNPCSDLLLSTGPCFEGTHLPQSNQCNGTTGGRTSPCNQTGSPVHLSKTQAIERLVTTVPFIVASWRSKNEASPPPHSAEVKVLESAPNPNSPASRNWEEASGKARQEQMPG